MHRASHGTTTPAARQYSVDIFCPEKYMTSRQRAFRGGTRPTKKKVSFSSRHSNPPSSVKEGHDGATPAEPALSGITTTAICVCFLVSSGTHHPGPEKRNYYSIVCHVFPRYETSLATKERAPVSRKIFLSRYKQLARRTAQQQQRQQQRRLRRSSTTHFIARRG